MMWLNTVLYLFCSFLSVLGSYYQPTGDEVQPGSVLLPATRRGRYLANIVRRQAVDGTGIKFNKDADRMNADAKKKVDVLSEELLPYIIAEQERRTTLHKRVMTAIQNGEKGVTIAEIRNKPPLIIRKGLLYRCPANRAPKEPDGSGSLMCEEDIVPTQVMYDSCLSAEDKELYIAENRFFFCNRHRVEGPDLPRNGSTVVGCAPMERTSLNYTTAKCTLEDTDYVVVHYRYYPDRTYKFVTELDPDREVCDHWNPCQIGYIYSLPSPDQAIPASDLWHDTQEHTNDYERDEIVPAVPEDSMEEFVHPNSKQYTTSPRIVDIPEGYEYGGVRITDNSGNSRKISEKHISRRPSPSARRSAAVKATIQITLTFEVWKPSFYGRFYCVFRRGGKEKLIRFLNIVQALAFVVPVSLESVHGQKQNTSFVPFKCNRCRLNGLMIRGSDGNVYNVDNHRFKLRDFVRQGKQQTFIAIEMFNLKPEDFGDYFAIIQNGDGIEERVKVCTILSPEKDTEKVVKLKMLSVNLAVGGHYDSTMTYTCNKCIMTDILCNGVSVLSAGRVSIIEVSKMISFNFPRFENSHACVYMGFFKNKDKVFKKTIAIIENNSEAVKILNKPVIEPPKEGEVFTKTIRFACDSCQVTDVFVNGLRLSDKDDRANAQSILAMFEATSSAIEIKISEYGPTFEGVFQAIFTSGGENITKTIMEIKDPKDDSGDDAATTTTVAADVTTVTGNQEASNSTANATTVAGNEEIPAGNSTTAATNVTIETTTKAA